jgi:hypothetical protein
MLKKVAVAFLAATMFAGPVLAQGTSATNPPAKTAAPASSSATAKAVTAKPASKSVKKVKRGKHGKHYAHVRHGKRIKQVRHMGTKPVHTARAHASTNGAGKISSKSATKSAN